ncbi:competence damage-inducible protein A [Candidatus Bathyarchaeota archaeon]|nr:competence damage-inducible protein A [Candidatus Bathyarchaeota archaeon]
MIYKIELLCIGNELLIGKTLNTNAQWLSEKITKLGGEVRRVTIIEDDVKTIALTLKEIVRRKPNLVITTGGLGPTFDDKTLQGFAKAFDRKLRLDEAALKLVRSRYSKVFKSRRYELTQPRLKMAMLPKGAKAIQNPVGTAPAVMLTNNNVDFLILPGVPTELKRIFNDNITSLIRKKSATSYFYETSFRINGLLESQIAPLIDEVLEEINQLYIKSHAQTGEGNKEAFLELHFTTKSKKQKTSENRIMQALILMTRLLSKHKIEWMNLNRDIIK